MAYEDLLKQFVYKNLFSEWLRARAQPQPYGVPLKQYEDTPAYFLSPENMAIATNALTPYDLFMHPSKQPIPLQNLTIALNSGGSPDMLGTPRGTTLLSNNKSWWHALNSWKDEIQEYPDYMPKPLIPQAIYEHEAGHTADPRFFGRYKTPESREAPAQLAEENFWRRIFSDYSKK